MSPEPDELEPKAPPPPGRLCTHLVLDLTLGCPLRCSHCCYGAGVGVSGSMSQGDMVRTIREAATFGSVRTVHFSGGDPFLLPDLMIAGIRLATELGMRTAAVTSGYWGKTPKRALATLEPMAAAGLSELSVSYDDMHAAFLPAAHLVNAVRAARELDLMVYVSVTVEPGSRIDGEEVRRLLGPELDEARVRINEVGINTTGRAAELADEAARRARAAADLVYRGSCRMVLRVIEVTQDGRVLPCCGVLPHADRMVIGRADRPQGLADALRNAARDPLWERIASVGPVELLVEATADTDRPLGPQEFDGICTACDRLFNDAELLELVRWKAGGQVPPPAGP